jgi:FkbM family methyltransferase
MKVIYDFGSNNGDDLPYYLKKADLVVAVEANPVLCDGIRARFQDAIAAGKLVVESKVLAVGSVGPEVPFYVHKTAHILSQFPVPDEPQNFQKVILPSCTPAELIAQYGEPYYIKIDIEHYDEVVLRALFEADIRPPFISAESHGIEVFAALVSLGGYKAFKLVDGTSVPEEYSDVRIDGERYSFPYHSAGPFGDDIHGPWYSPADFIKVLALEDLGWKDIHASNCREPPDSKQLRRRHLLTRMVTKTMSERWHLLTRKVPATDA